LASSPSVAINEIAWMGTKESYSNEWIELYNNLEEEIILDDWKIITGDNSLEIKLKGSILPKSYFILERTDDDTVPNIKADLIYKGSLNNKGEHLILINKKGEISDEVNCSSGWFAGDNKEKFTMERINSLSSGNDPLSWKGSNSADGSPKKETKKATPASISSNKENIASPATNSKEDFFIKKGAGAIDESFSKNNSFPLTFVISLSLAFLSGFFILYIRKRLS